MNGDIMEGGMQPDAWELQRRVQALEAKLEELRQELMRHYLQPHGNDNYGVGGHGFL